MIKLPEIARIKKTRFDDYSILLYNTFSNYGFITIHSKTNLIYRAFIAPKDVIEIIDNELLKCLEKDYTMKLTDIQTNEVKTYKIEY